VTGDQPDLLAELEPVGGGRGGEPTVLVGGALVGDGGLIINPRTGGEAESKANLLVGCRPFRTFGLEKLIFSFCSI
jgi:hypothetical protein